MSPRVLSCARLCAIILLVVSAPLSGDTRGKISGTIRDASDGSTMPGVNVFISAENLGAITDAQGFYSILNIPPGKHTVSASFIGYKLHTVQAVEVSSDQTTHLDFVMETAVLEGEEVIVTAEKPLVQADLTSTRSTITRDDIKALPNESFQALLAKGVGIGVGDFNNKRVEVIPGMEHQLHEAISIGVGNINCNCAAAAQVIIPAE